MGETRQHRHKVAARPKRQLSNELGERYPRNFCEASEFYRSHVLVDNLVSVAGGRPRTIRTVTPKNVFPHTNSTT